MGVKCLQSLDCNKLVLSCLWQTLLQTHSFPSVENKANYSVLIFHFASTLIFLIHFLRTVIFNK